MALYDLKNRIRAFHEIRNLNVGTVKNPRWIINKHLGDDYAETYSNDPVYAVQPGKVIFSGFSSTYGNYVMVRRSPRIVIRYHSLHGLSALKAGDEVATGDFVGLTGKSASGASGNHVHVQVEDGGIPIDPRPYIAGATFGGLETPANETAAPIITPPKPKPKLIVGDEDMAEPIYVKGDKDPAVYALYLNAEDSNRAEKPGPGAIYSGRRKVELGEFEVVTAIGFPHPKQESLITIRQDKLETINMLSS